MSNAEKTTEQTATIFILEPRRSVFVFTGMMVQFDSGNTAICLGWDDETNKIKYIRQYTGETLLIDPDLEVRPILAVVPGMGATEHYVSDCHAYTVIRAEGKRVWVQRDIAKVVSGSGHDGSAVYSYERNPEGPVREYSLRKNGRFVVKGSSDKDGTVLTIGQRREHRDPHF